MPVDMSNWTAVAAYRYARERWIATCRSFSSRMDDDALAAGLQPVLEAYGQPDRTYHNIFHISDCLVEFGRARRLFREPDAACAALIFHDSVYDATRHDNEERSADW